MKRVIQAILILACVVVLAGCNGEPDPLIVCMMGDPQLIMVPETPDNVNMAMNDILNLDHEFIAVLGDLAQGDSKYYTDYKELILNRSVKPVYSLAGNGDVGAGLSAYRQATGFPLYYSIYRRGIRFIFLSTVATSGKYAHICHIGSEQLSWLTDELEADKNSTTILFSHPPIFETTWHSEERDHLANPGSMYLSESAQLRHLLHEHPNIKIYAHGHLHHGYGGIDEKGRGDYYFEGNVLNISVAATANNQGSSFLFITKDEIMVKARNHQTETWIDTSGYEYSSVSTTLSKGPGEG